METKVLIRATSDEVNNLVHYYEDLDIRRVRVISTYIYDDDTNLYDAVICHNEQDMQCKIDTQKVYTADDVLWIFGITNQETTYEAKFSIEISFKADKVLNPELDYYILQEARIKASELFLEGATLDYIEEV